MAWVETRITRTSQPQDAAQLDRAGKFYSRLIAVLDPISRRDLVTDKPLTIVGSFPRTAGKYGRSAQGDAASLGYIAVSGLGAEISMLGVMNNATCGAAGSLEFGLGSSAGTALACYQATNSPSNRFLLRQTNGGGTSTVSFATNAYTTGPYVVGASIVGSLASQIVTYFNGQQDRGVVLDGSGGSNSVFNRFSIGGLSRSTNAGAQVGDDCALAVLISGALSKSEFESLSDNPWQILEPEVQLAWIDDATGAAPPGTTTVTTDASASYTVAGSVQADATAAYAVRSSATADAAASYKIASAAQQDATAQYAIRAAVTADASASYSLIAATSVTADASASYVVQGAVQQDASASYAVRAAVFADAVASYALIVDGQVTADASASYQIRGAVQSDASLAYEIAGAVQASASAGYVVQGMASADASAAYVVQGAVVADAAGSYLVDGVVLVLQPSIYAAYVPVPRNQAQVPLAANQAYVPNPTNQAYLP